MAGRLERFYESTFGAPQSRGELYAGFFLMISGFLLSLAGVAIYVMQVGEPTTPRSAPWKETGVVVAAMGPPAILMGISVSLPTRWTMRLLDGIGLGLCVAGIAAFMLLYPRQWNLGGAKEPWSILPYLAGCAALVASTLSSIVGYWVARHGTASGAVDDISITAPAYTYDIPDSVIEKDIELATRGLHAWRSGKLHGARPPLTEAKL